MNSDRGPKSDAPELIDLIGGRLEVVARMGTSDSDTVLFRGQLAPGKSVPLHSHVDHECFYVLSGCIEVFLADDMPSWRAIEAGHSLLVADSLKHSIRNVTDRRADLIMATNGRLARFFREAGGPVTTSTNILPRHRTTFSVSCVCQRLTATGSPHRPKARPLQGREDLSRPE